MRSQGFTPPGDMLGITEARRCTLAREQSAVAGRADHVTRARTAGRFISSPPVLARHQVVSYTPAMLAPLAIRQAAGRTFVSASGAVLAARTDRTPETLVRLAAREVAARRWHASAVLDQH